MVKFLQLFVTVVVVFIHANTTFSQNILKFSSTGGGPSGSGPDTNSKSVTFYNTFTGGFSPVSVVFSLQNQQYGPGTVNDTIEGIPTSYGASFGGASNSTSNSPINARPHYSNLGSVGGNYDTLFTASSSHPLRTGINPASDRSIDIFLCSDALAEASPSRRNKVPVNSKVYYADLVISFNKPVSNPVIQLSGLGSYVNIPFTRHDTIGSYVLGYSGELELISPALELTRLSGNRALSLSGTQINDTASYMGTGSIPGCIYGNRRICASGSVLVRGTNITTLVFKIYLKGDGGITNLTTTSDACTATSITSPDPDRYPNWTVGDAVYGDAFNIAISMEKPQMVSGNLFNDPDAGNVNNSSTGGGNIVPAGIFANIVDTSGRVVATTPLGPDGSYSFQNIFIGQYTVRLSSTAGVQGISPPSFVVPAGWRMTGAYTGPPDSGNTGDTSGVSAPFSVVVARDTANINFGIQRLPESAFNFEEIGVNPGGTVNTPVMPDWFQTNNVGVSSNTVDYDGGTVDSIRITTFPANATSITINGTSYYSSMDSIPGGCGTCQVWPAGGVSILYTNGVGPAVPITVDPVDGTVDVLINFVSIDNADAMDPTPGSLTLRYSSVLPVKLINFSAAIQNSQVLVQWRVSEEINVRYYDVERSADGKNYSSISAVSAVGDHAYVIKDFTPGMGINYYRLKSVDTDGSFEYGPIRSVVFGKDKTNVLLYPNPAKSSINVLLPNRMVNKPVTIKVVGVDGKVVITQFIDESNQEESINTGALLSGMYMLYIITDEENITMPVAILK